jgi:hypothetical protein
MPLCIYGATNVFAIIENVAGGTGGCFAPVSLLLLCSHGPVASIARGVYALAASDEHDFGVFRCSFTPFNTADRRDEGEPLY